MLKLDLPFHVAGGRPAASAVILAALSISIATRGKTYHVASDQRPEPDRAGSFGGTIWPRCLLPLSDEVSLEQQMLLPAAGDAVAISWRLLGLSPLPVRLTVSPIFRATQPFSGAGFAIEPETNGGRLAWRPNDRSSRIIADTNGRFIAGIKPVAGGVLPASFAFALGLRPAVLIFSREPRIETALDPLIGGFLAQLTEQRTAMSDHHDQRQLAAA